MNAFDNFGLRQSEEVVVALQIRRVISEMPAITGLIELEHLNHGAHRAVEDNDPLAK